MGSKRAVAVLLVVHVAVVVLIALAVRSFVLIPASTVAADFAEGLVSDNQNIVASTLPRGGYAGSNEQRDLRAGVVGNTGYTWVKATPHLRRVGLRPLALTFGYTFARRGIPVGLGDLVVDVSLTQAGWRVEGLRFSPRT